MSSYNIRLLDSAKGESPIYKTLEALEPDLSFDPVDALQALEDNPAHVLITRESFEEMDCVGLARTIREVDKENGHFTFIIVITEEERGDAFRQLDCFDLVYSAGDVVRLLYSSVLTAARLSEKVNRLQKSNLVLQQRCVDFQDTEMIDTLTELGNERYLEKSLTENITQIESRGGAVCVIYIGIAHFEELQASYDSKIVNELVIQVGQRIKSSVRPLDVVTHIGGGMFVLVLNQPSLDDCVPKSYTRIYDGVRLKSYRTKAGFVMVTIGMGFCASAAETGPPKREYLRNTAKTMMQKSFETETICFERFEP